MKEAKKQINLNDNKQSIIHIFNHNYIVDGKKFLEEPINVYADYLRHEMTFVTMPKNNIKNINQTFINCDIEVERLISCTFASAIELLNHNDFLKGAILVDIGFEKVSLGLFRNLALVNSLTLPVGINHIIKDISKICNLSMREAKIILENIDFSFIEDHQLFDENNYLKKNYFTDSNFRKISKLLIFNIIKARVDELFKLINKPIVLSGFDTTLGTKFFITGGGSNLLNIDIYFSKMFEVEVEKLPDSKNPKKKREIESFVSCLGALKLIKNGWETEAIAQPSNAHDQKKGFFAKIFGNLG